MLDLQTLKICCETGIDACENSWEVWEESEFLFCPLEMLLNVPFIH